MNVRRGLRTNGRLLTFFASVPEIVPMFKTKDYFILIASAIAFVYSVVLWFGALGLPDKMAGIFVAVWVPSILSLGCFTHLATRGNSNE